MNKDFALKFSKSLFHMKLNMIEMILFKGIKVSYTPLLAHKIPYSQRSRLNSVDYNLTIGRFHF